MTDSPPPPRASDKRSVKKTSRYRLEGRAAGWKEGKSEKSGSLSQQGLSHLPSFRIWCVKPRGLRPSLPPSLPAFFFSKLDPRGMSPGKEHQKSIAHFDLEPSFSVNYSTTDQCFWHKGRPRKVFHPLFFTSFLLPPLPRTPSSFPVSHGTVPGRGGFLLQTQTSLDESSVLV